MQSYFDTKEEHRTRQPPVSGLAKAHDLSIIESTSKIDNHKISMRSPRNKSYTDYEATLKRKPSESLAEYKRRITLSDLKHDKVDINKQRPSLTSHQIVLPIQSPASSRRASMKIESKDLHFARQSVGDSEPLTTRATTAPHALEPTSHEARRPSISKKEVAVELIDDVLGVRNGGNVAKRALSVERGKNLAQSMKFSSPQEIVSRNEALYGKHVYIQPDKSIVSNAMGSHTARELHLGFKNILHEPEKNLKLKLKNIVARLRPNNMKAESQACYRQSFLRLSFAKYGFI